MEYAGEERGLERGIELLAGLSGRPRGTLAEHQAKPPERARVFERRRGGGYPGVRWQASGAG